MRVPDVREGIEALKRLKKKKRPEKQKRQTLQTLFIHLLCYLAEYTSSGTLQRWREPTPMGKESKVDIGCPPAPIFSMSPPLFHQSVPIPFLSLAWSIHSVNSWVPSLTNTESRQETFLNSRLISTLIQVWVKLHPGDSNGRFHPTSTGFSLGFTKYACLCKICLGK